MKTYVCTACGYAYDPDQGDPDSGIQPGTSFESLPDDWVCPPAAHPNQCLWKRDASTKSRGFDSTWLETHRRKIAKKVN